MSAPLPDPAATDEPQSKRRKVRKGTQSCWECKRRKIRCNFSGPLETVCDNCKRRWTVCISQEYPDDSEREATTSAVHIGAQAGASRLRRLEQLMELLVNKDKAGVESVDEAARDLLRQVPSFEEEQHTGSSTLPHKSSSPPGPTAAVPEGQLAIFEHFEHNETTQSGLRAAWPVQHDLDIISAAPIGISGLIYGEPFKPYATYLPQDMPSPKEVLQLPPPGSHPVLLARKLLLLVTYLQSIPPYLVKDLLQAMTIDYRLRLMPRIIETVNRLVTSNDELVDSVDGLELVMMQGMYHNNAGNLRRAWLLVRRAMAMAQMMGLDRDVIDASSLKTLASDTVTRLDVSRIWFCIVRADRYLSLMLGLSQGSADSNNFANDKILETCSPMEQMERLFAAAGGRMLQRRNSKSLHDLAETQCIGRILHRASSSMPPRWWLAPDITTTTAKPAAAHDDMEAMQEMIRLINQITHFSLVMNLHLPFMLHSSSSNPQYDLSKITAVNASRDVLLRFMILKDSGMGPAYCRGIDFIAFIASTILCLAHITLSPGHRRSVGVGGEHGYTIFSPLSYQRLGDRGLLERVCESMESKAHDGEDPIASSIAGILSHLLVIEADAARGSTYNASSSLSPDSKQDLMCGGDVHDGGHVLRIHIPHFGTVTIERGIRAGNASAGQQEARPVSSHNAAAEQLLAQEMMGNSDDWALQGVDMALFDSLIRGAELSDLEGVSWT